MQRIPTNCGKLWAGSKKDAIRLLDTSPAIVYDIIWNLAEELNYLSELEKCYASRVLNANIKDFNIPTKLNEFNKQLDIVLKTLHNNGKVFVHCWGGLGRSGLAITIILKYINNLDTKSALEISRNYFGEPETSKQRKFVERFIKA